MKQLLLTAIIAVVVFIGGYFLGKKKAVIKEGIKYEKQQPIVGNIPIDLLQPSFEFETDIKDLPNYYFIDNTQNVDTAKIISDFMKLREYSVTLFDNSELGKLDLKPTLQFNKLSSLDYIYYPTQKVVTRTVERKFQPFISANYSTNNTGGVGGGAFVGNLGVEVLFNKSMTNTVENLSYTTFGLKYKF